MYANHVAAGVPPQTPLGELTALPQTLQMTGEGLVPVLFFLKKYASIY